MSHECYCGEISPYFDHILRKIATKNKTKCLSYFCQVWQNCLMLHSLDRLTSLFLHALAPLTLHVIRFDKSIVSLTSSWPSSSLSINLTMAINHRRQPHNGHHRRQHHHWPSWSRWSDNWDGPTQLGISEAIVLPVIFYLAWQVLNFFESSCLAGTLQTKLLWIITNRWF